MHYSQKERFARKGRFDQALAEKFDEIAFRPDLHVSDYLQLDSDSAYVALSHAEGLQPPTVEEVFAFVDDNFESKLVPVMATAKYSADASTVVVLVSKAETTRPITDVAKMATVLAGHRYLDAVMQDTWEVVAGPDGQKYLRRKNDDDVMQMLSERKQRMASANRYVSIANMLSSGQASVGDTVRVYHRGEIYADCEVKAAKDRTVTVKIPHVGEVQLDKHAIISVQALGAKHADSIKKQDAEYYKKIYPKEYANQLTNELVDEGAQDNQIEKFINPRG